MYKTILTAFVICLVFKSGLYSQEIKIISPDANTVWIGNSPNKIVYIVSLASNNISVTIQISLDTGKSWRDIPDGKNISKNNGVHEFTYEKTPNKNLKAIIKIYAENNIEVISKYFEIQNKIQFIEFIYPKKDDTIKIKHEEKDKIIFKRGNAGTIDSIVISYNDKENKLITKKIGSNIKTEDGYFVWYPFLTDDNFICNSFKLKAHFNLEDKTESVESEYFTVMNDGIYKDKSKDYLLNTGSTFNYQDNFDLTGAYFNLHKDFKEIMKDKSLNFLLGMYYYKSKLINNNNFINNNVSTVKIENTISSYNFEGLMYMDYVYKNCFNLDYLYWGIYAEKRKSDVSSIYSFKVTYDSAVMIDTVTTAFVKKTKDSTSTLNSTIDEQFLGVSPIMLFYENKNIEIKAIPIFTWNIISGNRNRSKFIMKFNLMERNSKINIGGEYREYLFGTNYDNRQTELMLYFAKDFSFNAILDIFFK